MTDKQYNQLIDKLDQITKILSYQILPEDGNLTEKVRILKSLGLTNGQMSEILNISQPTVRALSSRIKKI